MKENKLLKKISDNLDMFAQDMADKMINFFQKNNEKKFIIAAHKKNGGLTLISDSNKTTVEIGNTKNSTGEKYKNDDLIELININLPEKPENLKDMSDCIIGTIFGSSTLIDDNLDNLDVNDFEADIYDIPNKIIKKTLKPEKLIKINEYLFFKLNILNDYSSRMLLGCVKDIDTIMSNIVYDFSIVNNNENGIFEAVMIGRCSPIYPTIKQKEKILIDTKDKKNIVDGEIYACCLSKSIYDTTINMYRVYKKDNGFLLKVDNPALYIEDDGTPVKHFEDKLIRQNDIQNVIIGRVIKKEDNQ
jgi:hypothetical protein